MKIPATAQAAANRRAPRPAPARGRVSTPPLLALQRSAGNAAVSRLVGPIVHRFGTGEHETLGNAASGGADVQLTSDYRLTYGEMVAMAGDFFASLEQMREFAARPPWGAGTRDELEYVRRVKVHGETVPAYDQESSPAHSAKVAADARYYALAGRNQSHFLHPAAEEGMPVSPEAGLGIAELLENAGLPASNVLSGTRRNYRNYHLLALRDAVQAGRDGGSIDAALAAEAFAGHYLTDSFSGGHLRTQRTSISEHWNARVPLFPMQLEGYVAERLAEDLQRNVYSLGPFAIREDILFGVARSKVREALAAKGAFTFADLVSGSLHDYDNTHGVRAAVQTENSSEVVTLFGDDHLGQGAEERLAVRAVQLGIGEVRAAHRLGAAGGSVQDALRSLVTEGQFAPEAALPVALPDTFAPADQAAIRWDFATVDELLGDGRFQQALRLFFTAKAAELEGAASSFSADQAAAFRRTVVTPLQSDPIQMIRNVLAWTPDTGGGALGHNTDDNALEFVQAAARAGGLGTLTLSQRTSLIGNLLDGATVGDEEDAILDLLRTAPEGDRRSLIRHFGWGVLHDKLDDLSGEDFADAYPEAAYSEH